MRVGSRVATVVTELLVVESEQAGHRGDGQHDAPVGTDQRGESFDGGAFVGDVFEDVVHHDDVGVRADRSVEDVTEVHDDPGGAVATAAAYTSGSGSHASTAKPASCARRLNNPAPQPMFTSRPGDAPFAVAVAVAVTRRASQRSVMSYFARGVVVVLSERRDRARCIARQTRTAGFGRGGFVASNRGMPAASATM